MTTPPPSHRALHALLRLYPRAWRERYGDEFLALVGESGLTWRVVLDVVLSACAQRVRAAWLWRAQELEDRFKRQPARDYSFAGDLGDVAAFFALVALLVVAFVAAGATWPTWTFWFWLASDRHGAAQTVQGGSRTERIGAAYYFFLESLALVGAIMLTAIAAHRAGLIEPPKHADVVLVLVGCIGLGRFGYAWARCVNAMTTWRGMSTWELRGWAFVIGVGLFAGALAEPNMRMFWITALVPFLVRGFPLGVRPIDIERRRAVYELEQQRLREKFLVQSFPRDWQ